MNSDSYLKHLAAFGRNDIRNRQESLLIFLRSLDAYQWQSLLLDICKNEPAAKEVFVAQPGELVAKVTATLRQLSERTIALVTESLENVIKSLTALEEPDTALKTACHIAYVVGLKLDASALSSLISDRNKYDSKLRRVALAALTKALVNPDFWKGIEIKDDPESAPIVVQELLYIDTVLSLQRLAEIYKEYNGLEILDTKSAIMRWKS